jgi:adenylate cyclase
VDGTRRLVVIMFTDMVGYTAAAQVDEAATLALRREQENLIRPVLAAYRGREVKSTGDGFLVAFESALKAIECAIGIQRRLHEHNEETGVTPIRLRIGIHLGDVEEQGTDIFGDAVNIASRIEPAAEPGGICISGAVYEQVRSKIPDKLEKLPPRALKGLRDPMEIYRVVLPWTVREPQPASSGPARLAVLPFANISPDPNDEYFADGLTEELISTLSKIRELRVIARTSVSQYKSTSKSVSQIGAELDVKSVLEGSVRKAGHRIRISLQLIDAGTQEHIWANSYDRDLDDVFAIQSDIAERTAGALRLELLGPERESIRKKPTSDLAAYNLYLRGLHATRQTSLEGWTESVKFFEEAIRKDPDFSVACASLANAYLLLSGETMSHRNAFAHAAPLVARALELDPSSSDAHVARGNLALQQEHDWALAEREFKMAISLNPSNSDAHWWYSILLTARRRFGESIEELRTTIRLDPLWKDPKYRLILMHSRMGDHASAIALTEELRESDPSDPMVHFEFGFEYALIGRLDDARRELDLLAAPIPDRFRPGRAILSAILGNPEEARRLVEELERASQTKYVKGTSIAALYAAVGERAKALERLERDDQAGETGLWAVYQNESFDSVRGDPRFQALLKKLGLA